MKEMFLPSCNPLDSPTIQSPTQPPLTVKDLLVSPPTSPSRSDHQALREVDDGAQSLAPSVFGQSLTQLPSALSTTHTGLHGVQQTIESFNNHHQNPYKIAGTPLQSSAPDTVTAREDRETTKERGGEYSVSYSVFPPWNGLKKDGDIKSVGGGNGGPGLLDFAGQERFWRLFAYGEIHGMTFSSGSHTQPQPSQSRKKFRGSSHPYHQTVPRVGIAMLPSENSFSKRTASSEDTTDGPRRKRPRMQNRDTNGARSNSAPTANQHPNGFEIDYDLFSLPPLPAAESTVSHPIPATARIFGSGPSTTGTLVSPMETLPLTTPSYRQLIYDAHIRQAEEIPSSGISREEILSWGNLFGDQVQRMRKDRKEEVVIGGGAGGYGDSNEMDEGLEGDVDGS